ncbi:MAG: aminotransferase class V-fold PLP-dependent enzyme [Cellvibrionaceae bacterium]
MSLLDAESMFCLNDDIYLLNHSVGKLPRSTREIFEQDYFSPWENADGDPWSRWLTIIENFQQALAQLFNGQPHEFCPQANISSALSKLLGALQVSDKRKTLLYSENDFPSTGFVIQQAKRLGFNLKIIPKTLDPQDLNVWSDHLTNDISAVLIAHVHYNTSRLIAVEDITRLCRQRGIFSVVDIAQSAGIVPIDLQTWSADAVIGSSVKWLCGGSGAAYLWLKDEVAEHLAPTDVGWFSHQSPFEFDINHFRYHSGALRFWGGTPSVAPYCMATNGINTIHGIGVDKIRRHNQQITQPLAEELHDYGHHLNTPLDPEIRGGTLVIKLAEKSDCKIQEKLRAQNIKFDARALGIRISPHIYNSSRQIGVLREALKLR